MSISQELFLDSSKLEEIKKWGPIVGGVTTNQLIMFKDGVRDIDGQIRKICELVPNLPVSVELMDSRAPTEELVREAQRLHALGENVVIKVPITEAGMEEPFDPRQTSTRMLELVSNLVSQGIPVNVTAMMTDMQMKLAVMATEKAEKNTFVSLFWARSSDDSAKYRTNPAWIAAHPNEFGAQKESIMGAESGVNRHPSEIVKSVARFIGDRLQPRIIVGSIRSVAQVEEASAAGAHIITVTPDVLRAGLFSRRSLETIAEFDKAGKDILGK